MLFNTPIKGEDGFYFVKTLSDENRKVLVQLDSVKMMDVSGEITMEVPNTDKLTAIDNENLKAAQENCSEWFGKQLSENVIKSAYTSGLKDDQITVERLDVTKVFNTQRESIDFDNIQPNKICDVILEFAGLWFAKKAFGPVWNLVQVKVHDDPILDTYPEEYAFIDGDDQ